MSSHVLNSQQSNRKLISWITKVSLLAAIAFILMLFEFPLPFAPAFYKLGFDEVAVMIAGFALGPLAAVATEALKIVLNLLFNGTTTAGVGELMNFLIGLSYVLPASIYYRSHHSRKGAYIALLIGTASLTVIGAVLNYFIAIPMYSFFYGMPMDAIIGMGSAINPLITNRLTFCLYAVAPFNFVKGVVSSLIVALIYKRISVLLHK